MCIEEQPEGTNLVNRSVSQRPWIEYDPLLMPVRVFTHRQYQPTELYSYSFEQNHPLRLEI